MSLEGKTAFVLVENFYEDLEVWYPLLRLREAGAEVLTVGPNTETEYKGKYGYPIKADRAAKDVKGTDADILVIPGGYSPDHMRRHEDMIRVVREAAAGGKVVASICHGAWMLASANAVRGKRMTCFFAIKDDVINAGAEWIDEEVVVDGNLVTSRKPADLPAFCREIIRKFAS
ncbi:type 1 glutamine amidotransferase [bacterium]|nr:type 1 glutamine amidotransferase [bacterium]